MKNPIQRAMDLPTSNGGAPTFNVNVNPNAGQIIDLGAEAPLDSITSPNSTPSSLGQTIVSNTGSGAAAITAYFLNEDIYNATPTNNGSAASSVSITYADGWSGNGYNALAKAVNQGKGIMCYGFTLEYITTSGGAQNPSGLTTANPTHLTSVNSGNGQAPVPVPLNQGVRNTQFQSGTQTVKKAFYLSAINQFSYGVPVGNTVNLTILTRPFVA